MNQNNKYGGNFGYRHWQFEFFLPHQNFSTTCNAPGCCRSCAITSVTGPGHCYKFGKRSSSCVLRHATGVLFCLYVKLFLLYFFNSVDCASSLALCYILGLQEKINKDLGVFIDGKVQGCPLRPPEKKPSKQEIWCTRNLHGLEGTMDVWIAVISPAFLLEIWVVNSLPKRQKKSAWFLASYWIKWLKIWMIMTNPKFGIFLILQQKKNCRFARDTHSGKLPHFTLQSLGKIAG